MTKAEAESRLKKAKKELTASSVSRRMSPKLKIKAYKAKAKCVKCGKPVADFSDKLCQTCFDNLEIKCSGCDYNVSGPHCLCQALMAATCIPEYSGMNILEQMATKKVR